MRLPDFYIIGAPKCGTTTLYEWLSEHPLINAPHKEACFFSQDIFPTRHLRTHIPSLQEYCNIFELKGDQVLSGEATPKYLYSDDALAKISGLKPDARIIVILRDPVDLVISLHNQKLREGVEVETNFEKVWAESLASHDGSGPQVPHERNYYLWACIGSRLERLYEYFSASAVLILLTSELRDNPQSCYRKVLLHLGIPDDNRVDFSSYNEREAIRSLQLHRFALGVKGILSPLLSPLYRLRGGKGLGLLKLIKLFNAKPGRYTSSVSSEVRAQMYELLEKEIKLAEKYLDGRKITSSKG